MKRYVIGEFEGLVEDHNGDWMRHEDHLKEMADANHMLLLANNSRDTCMRVAEQRQGEVERLRRAVEWCLERGAKRAEIFDPDENDGCGDMKPGIRDAGCDCCSARLEIPAEFADIINPTTGASNG